MIVLLFVYMSLYCYDVLISSSRSETKRHGVFDAVEVCFVIIAVVIILRVKSFLLV